MLPVCGVPPKLKCGVVGIGVADPTGVPGPNGVIEPGVPTSLGCILFGVEKSPLTGGPPAGFSDEGVLLFVLYTFLSLRH
jgi:hypothetical protein